MTADGTRQRQLAVAANARLVGPRLARALAFPPEAGRTCRVLDVRHEPGVRCALLYELAGTWISGALEWSAEGGDAPGALYLPDLGLRVDPLGRDARLPGMALALDCERLRPLVERAVSAGGGEAARVLRCRAAPVRYRPGIRCTVRVDARVATGAARPVNRTLYVKAYRADGERTVVVDAMRRLSSSPACRAGAMRLAAVAADVSEWELVLQEAVPGVPLELLLGTGRGRSMAGDPRGWAGVVESARAMAAIHTAAVPVARRRPLLDELAELVGSAARAEGVAGAGSPRFVELASALREWAARLAEWGAEVKFTHGDCKPNQVLVHQGGVAVLDFDLCAAADPALDIGTYLATLRQIAVHAAARPRTRAGPAAFTSWLRALEARFLEAYCAASGAGPDFALRATYYEAVALLRKSLRAFARSPRSPLPAAQVAEARRCLEALPPARARAHRSRPTA